MVVKKAEQGLQRHFPNDQDSRDDWTALESRSRYSGSRGVDVGMERGRREGFCK